MHVAQRHRSIAISSVRVDHQSSLSKRAKILQLDCLKYTQCNPYHPILLESLWHELTALDWAHVEAEERLLPRDRSRRFSSLSLRVSLRYAAVQTEMEPHRVALLGAGGFATGSVSLSTRSLSSFPHHRTQLSARHRPGLDHLLHATGPAIVILHGQLVWPTDPAGLAATSAHHHRYGSPLYPAA